MNKYSSREQGLNNWISNVYHAGMAWPLSHNKSYVHQPGIQPFIGLTMHELLEERVEKHPDREMHVFVSDNERLTFVEYKRKVVDLAAGLLNYGLRRGDCVAVVGCNHMEWPLVLGATWALGIATVCIQIGHTVKALQQILIKTSCKVLFLARSPENLYSVACKMIPELKTSTPGELRSKDIPTLNMVIAAGANHQSGTMKFDDVALSGCESKVTEASQKVTIDDISHIYMTSGTTGIPKLVHTSHFRALNEAIFKSSDYYNNEIHRFACLGAIGYISVCRISQIAPLVLGSTSVYPSPTYSLPTFLQAAQDEKCNNVVFMRNALIDLAYSPTTKQYDLSNLKSGIIGGSPIPPTVIIHIKKTFNINVVITYGASETAMISMLRHKNLLETVATVGRPLQNVEVQIVGKNGLPLKIGEKGEVWVRSPAAFSGYYGDAETTKEVKTKDGWVRTGDVGKLNVDGYLTLVGRIKDIVIRYGQNVYPTEVEGVIINHPAVKQVQVVGVPNYRIGEDICACIRLNTDCTVNEDELKSYCLDKVQTFALPSYVLVFEFFPFGITGKIDRKKLRELAIGRIPIPDDPAPYVDHLQ